MPLCKQLLHTDADGARRRQMLLALGPRIPRHTSRRSRYIAFATNRPGSAATGGKNVYCSLSVLVDSVEIEAFSCWKAAHEIWPDIIVGAPSLYVEYMRRMWSAVRSAEDGVLLARVLAEEGVIGGRSSSGRKGPVVGLSPKYRGVRPLNPIEIVSNWRILKDTCLAKWGLAGLRDDQTTRDRLTQLAVHNIEKMLFDDASVQDDVNYCIRTYPSVLEAVRGSEHNVVVLSPYPSRICYALLHRGGYQADDVSHVECGGAEQAMCQVVRASPCSSEPIASSGELHSSDEDAANSDVHIIMDNVYDLIDMQAALRQGVGDSCLFAASSSEQAFCKCIGADRVTRTVTLHMCDWGYCTPSMRARAAGHGNLNILSDVSFASLMDVTHLDVVMDGVKWR